jgi:hypothetical protein
VSKRIQAEDRVPVFVFRGSRETGLKSS